MCVRTEHNRQRLKATILVAACAVLLGLGCATTAFLKGPFREYDGAIVQKVRTKWYTSIDSHGYTNRTGVVTAHFQLLEDGMIRNLKLTRHSKDSQLDEACLKAISESAPFDPLPESLRKIIGKEPREVSFTFYY